MTPELFQLHGRVQSKKVEVRPWYVWAGTEKRHKYSSNPLAIQPQEMGGIHRRGDWVDLGAPLYDPRIIQTVASLYTDWTILTAKGTRHLIIYVRAFLIMLATDVAGRFDRSHFQGLLKRDDIGHPATSVT